MSIDFKKPIRNLHTKRAAISLGLLPDGSSAIAWTDEVSGWYSHAFKEPEKSFENVPPEPPPPRHLRDICIDINERFARMLGFTQTVLINVGLARNDLPGDTTEVGLQKVAQNLAAIERKFMQHAREIEALQRYN